MDLEQELQAALAPREPGPAALAAVMTRLSAGPGRATRRKGSGIILLGTVLAVAAAASMLALQLAGEAKLQQLATAPSPAPVTSTAVVEVAVPPAAPETQVDEAKAVAVKAVSAKPPLAEVPAFTVRVLPLENNATAPAAKRAVDTFHSALLDGLRSVPGLVLVTEQSTGFAPDAPTDIRLRLRGSEMAGDQFVVMVAAERPQSKVVQPIEVSGSLAPCVSASAPRCGDPTTMAGVALQLLRKSLFPIDPAAPQALRARILDPSLDFGDRLTALVDLSMQTTIMRVGTDPGARLTLVDAQMARSLADIAASAPDPAMRAQVWRSVREMGATNLVPAMANSLRLDRDGDVRIEAATTLATEFRSIPEAHAAMEAAAREDPLPMVRAMARRGLQGESEWIDYLITTLKTTTLAPKDRLKPLFHTVNTRGRLPGLAKVLNDDAAIEAFADAFSQIQATASPELPTMVLLSGLGSIYHPAITGVLIDSLEHATQPAVRQSIVSQLLLRRNADERVQAVFRKLSVEDADPEVRQMVAGALRSSTAP